MKIALIHDWLTGMRGGEKCLEALCELYPDADLFTLIHNPGSVSPTIERRGFLMIPTTRGTRFFLGLLGSAYIHLAWIGFTDLALWIATILSVGWMIIVIRWG